MKQAFLPHITFLFPLSDFQMVWFETCSEIRRTLDQQT